MKPAYVLAALAACILLAAPLSFAQSKSTEDTLSNLPGCWGVHETKQLSFTYSAYGVLGLSRQYSWPCGPACEINGTMCGNFTSPAESNAEYLFAGALWVGGQVGGDTIVSVSMAGWHREEEFSPVVTGDNPKAGIERFESVSDYSLRSRLTDSFLSTLEPNPNPLGVELIWRTHTWDRPMLSKAVVHDLTITNVSDQPIEEGAFGLYIDADVGLPQDSEDANDDMTGSLRNYRIGYVVDNDGNPGETGFTSDSPRRCIAARYLATSFAAQEPTYNWWVSNTNSLLDYGPRRDDSLYRDFGHGGTGTPINDWQKYYVMTKPEWDFDQVFTAFTDSLDQDWREPPTIDELLWSTGTDTRFLVSIGKFNLPPDSSVRIIFTTFTAEGVHQDPNIGDLLWSNYPTAYREALNFDDLIAVAQAAEGLADSIRSAIAPVSGLRAHLLENGKTALTWDPYVFAGLDGYELYVEEVDPSLLPYPGTCPPWLTAGENSPTAKLPAVSRYEFDTAMNPERFYLMNIAQRKSDTLGMRGKSVIYRPGERAEAPGLRTSEFFLMQSDRVRVEFEPDMADVVDHFNVYLLPAFADTADLYHPFYDRGEARTRLMPVDSFQIDESRWYYYAMQPALQVDGRFREFSLDGVGDSMAIVVTSVSPAGFESEFSSAAKIYQTPERDRDVLVLTRGSISTAQAYPDSITQYYHRLLSGLDYQIYSVGDSTPRPADWPWWLVMMPYRLTIVDDDLADRLLLFASLEQMENYALSGGHLVVCGALFEHSGASFVDRSAGWFPADTIAQRLLGIDSVFAIGLGYYEQHAAPPYVDSLGGFTGATPGVGEPNSVTYDPSRDPLRPLLRNYWPINTAPITAAFHVTDGATVDLRYKSLYPAQSHVHGRPVVVSKRHGLGKITTAGFHLWYMEPATIEQWLSEFRNKSGAGDARENDQLLPSKIALSQNYPNPFNPTTTISFSLPSAGPVRLEILNALGRRVAKLVDSYRPAGSYSVTWDGSAYSSGVYFYRLRTREISLSKKMLLVK